MKDNNYFTHRLIKTAKTFKNIFTIVTIIFIFYTALRAEVSGINWTNIVVSITLIVASIVICKIVDTNFNYSKIPEQYGGGLTVIKFSESYMRSNKVKHKSYLKEDKEDHGYLKGLLRGYCFEYRKGNKVAYTKIKLFSREIEDTDFKDFLDSVYESFGYYPTGRVVFRGYYLRYGNKYKRIDDGELLIDQNRAAIIKGVKVNILDRSGNICDNGIVTSVDYDHVNYMTHNKVICSSRYDRVVVA